MDIFFIFSYYYYDTILIDNNLGTEFSIGTSLLGGIYLLIILVPSLAVSVRRLQDVNKNGWMLLIALITLIGAFWLLILFCKDSQQEENN